MRPSPNSLLFLALLAGFTACGSREAEPQGTAPVDHDVVRTGRLQNPAIDEASGLARSNLVEGLLWVINDSEQPAALHAIGGDGSDRGRVQLPEADTFDREDLASFEWQGKPWLLIADIGDNDAVRDHVSLQIVEERNPGSADDGAVSWQAAYRYPGGPRDAEAAAVDAAEGLVYILSKRTLPPELYTVPLMPAGEDFIGTARRLGPVTSLPTPTSDDLKRAPLELNWHWQPTAMDFSPDGTKAAILTYKAVYLYDRADGESWFAALQGSPVVYELAGIKEAESVSIGNEHIFITVEAINAPIYRIDYRK